MTDIFIKVINMSIVGTMAIFIVLITRMLIKNRPKIFSYALWFLIFFRLICPISFSSAYSLIGSINKDIEYININHMQLDEEIITKINPSSFEYVPTPTTLSSIELKNIIFQMLSIIWCIGVIVFLVISILSYIRIYKKVQYATLLYDNVYETDKIESPFVMGVKPKIYIPVGIEDNELRYILEHEKKHIQRKDHIFKLVSYAIVIIHWFNPLVWISYNLMSKDMEMSCDESVVKNGDIEDVKSYSYALLNVSAKNSGLLRPLGFGESNIKQRIKNIHGYKKISIIAFVATLAFCLLAGFFVLANPHGANTNGKKLAGVLREYEGTDLNLNSIIGFDYDYFVQFEPYADKNSMEEFIGFKCAILEESVSEEMMNILFVKDNKPVCYIYGYPSNNGFYLSVPTGQKIYKDNIGEFYVDREGEIPAFRLKESENLYNIAHRAEALLKSKNLYIGNHIADGKIIGLLTWPEKDILNGIELQTTNEPYGLTIDIITDGNIEDFVNYYIGSSIYYRNALILLALIDNCGSVSYRFNDNQIVTFTREQVEKNVGYDVRLMTKNKVDFKRFLEYSEGAEDYSDIIQKLDLICRDMDLKNDNINEIIKRSENDYEYLLKYGNKSVTYILAQFNQGINDDLRDSIMSRVVYDVLGVQCNVNPQDYSKTSEWFKDFKIRDEIILYDKFSYDGNDKIIKCIYDFMIMQNNLRSDYKGNFLPWIYVFDTIEQDGRYKVFIKMSYQYFNVYNTENGAIIDNQGGLSIPAVVTIEKSEDGIFVVSDMQQARDGGEYATSIRSMCVDFDNNELKEIADRMIMNDDKLNKEINKIYNLNLDYMLKNNSINNIVKDNI